MSAAVNLNQMADLFWHAFHTEDPSRIFNAHNMKDFRRLLIDKHPDFVLIRDVADAHKHVKLERSDRHLTGVIRPSQETCEWQESI